MSEGNGLPKGWADATLGDLITLTQNGFGKRSQESGRPTVVLRLADITDGEITLADPRRVNATPEEIQQYELKPDDLLAIRVNGSPDIVGRVVRFVGADQPVLFCDHFIHLRLPESGLARYLRYFADTRAVRRFVEENKVSSAGQNTVNQSTLMRLPVSIAPLPEQHRIVEKIEELFSDLDAGVTSLERAKANLKRYRASVLKSAVEGRLTEEWRREHPQAEDGGTLLDRILRERREKWERDQLQKFKEKGKEPPKNWQSKYKEPSAPDTSELPELPEGWAWATIHQLNSAVRPISYGVLQPGDDLAEGVPLVRVCDVADGKVAIGQLKRIAPEISAQFQRTILQGGEVLLTVVGTIGRTAIAPRTLAGANTARAVVVIAVVAPAIPEYLELCLREGSMRVRLTQASHEVARKTLNLEDVRVVAIPLPPLAEQEQIVALVEERLSQIDSAEKTIDAELIRSKRLRQSILKTAFEGKLVPQDPKDEPASTLLERIKTSREAEQPKKKAKKVKSIRLESLG